MYKVYSKTILASYATFKELYKSRQYNSPYQILSEFIHYIISINALFYFTSTDIQNYLYKEFGFNPPLAVIRTALKNMSGVTRENGAYRAEKGNSESIQSFQKCRERSEKDSKTIIKALGDYAKEKNLNLDTRKLSQELVLFVLDEVGDQTYQNIISEFVLNNNSDEIKQALLTISEGSILYSGLAFNITEFGSLKQELTLYLDTEILFDIAGLNGEIYQTLAHEFIKLVNEANRGGKKITLRFFPKVEEDVEQFYYRAEKIVSGFVEFNMNEAMKEIVQGCNDASDVVAKKVDFYRKLQKEFSIYKDEKRNYYSESDIAYNLEGINLPQYPCEDEQNTEGYMFCSHINKLRKGEQKTDCLSSKYLCITDTRRVLEISKALAEHLRNGSTGERYCDYAVSLSHITNLLWYKMNRGFGSEQFPSNLDSVLKARLILSSYISQGITSTYEDIKKKTSLGELTEEQAASYIVALKEKATLPEDLDCENVAQSLDFSKEYFENVAETISKNRNLLSDREETIKQLSNNVKQLKNELMESGQKNDEKDVIIQQLSKRISDIENQQLAEKKNKQIKKQNGYLLGR